MDRHSTPVNLRPEGFARDTRGSMSLMFGFMAVCLFALIGGAIDYARWNNAHTRTRDTIDAALLAAGRQLQTEPDDLEKALSVAQTYFDETAKNRLTLQNSSAQFQVVDNGTGIKGHATGTVKTPFMSLLNIDGLPIDATAQASLSIGSSRGGSEIEVSLMLDVTGSMCDDGIGPCSSSSKLDALKDSAKDLVNILVREDATEGTARIAVVPFSTRVRLERNGQGGALMKAVTNLDPKWTGWYEICKTGSGSGGSETNGNWICLETEVKHFNNWKIMPCVTDRNGIDEFTDAAPGSNRWVNAHDGGRSTLSWDSSDTPLTEHTGQTPADPGWHWNYEPNGWCADIGEKAVLLPLTSDKDELKDHIDDLEAYGSTAGALGTAWTWYTLSPEWAGIFGVDAAPKSYSELSELNANGTPKLRKIAVLMTDGVYNTLRQNKLADPVLVSDYAEQLCTNMKAKGIEIYTVGFELDQLPPIDRTRAEKVLKSCGTDLQHFYDALNSEELKKAFREIGLRLATLYLSK